MTIRDLDELTVSRFWSTVDAISRQPDQSAGIASAIAKIFAG